MQQPAIQAALDNLVEVIRTALTAEFLEYFRGAEEPIRAKRPKAGTKSKTAKKAPRKAAKPRAKAVKKTARRAP